MTQQSLMTLDCQRQLIQGLKLFVHLRCYLAPLKVKNYQLLIKWIKLLTTTSFSSSGRNHRRVLHNWNGNSRWRFKSSSTCQNQGSESKRSRRLFQESSHRYTTTWIHLPFLLLYCKIKNHLTQEIIRTMDSWLKVSEWNRWKSISSVVA